MTPNPYNSPALTTAIAGNAVARPIFRRTLRALLSLGVVVAFAFAVGVAIWLFYNGYPWTIGSGALVVFMIAAGFAGTSWHERTVLSASVPFFAFGGYLGYHSYFARFSFSWFAAIFHSKGSGPAGLILFVSLFAVGIGFAGGLCLDRLVKWLLPKARDSRTTKQDGADSPESPNHCTHGSGG